MHRSNDMPPTIQLPSSTARGPARTPKTPQTSSPSRPHRLLLAEDDGELRYLLASALRADGHNVVAVATGVDLLDVLADSMDSAEDCPAFDLVLSDLRMPGWPGLEALARIATNPSMPPFILFTSFGDEETRRRALEIGALTLLDKPFDFDDLCELVDHVLS